jgi:hypothetical protein
MKAQERSIKRCVISSPKPGDVVARAGDVIVDRGIMHSWRNDSDTAGRDIDMLCPAHSAGKGATVQDISGS